MENTNNLETKCFYNNSFCQAEDERAEIYGQINEVYQNAQGSEIVRLLSKFHISDLRDFLYSSCSEQYAYNLIEEIQMLKILRTFNK